MDILVEDLDEKTVEELETQAAARNTSLQAYLKFVVEKAVEEREQWKAFREHQLSKDRDR